MRDWTCVSCIGRQILKLRHQGSPVFYVCGSVSVSFSSVQLLTHVRSLQPHGLQHCQASLSFTVSQSLLKHMSIESVMPSNHLIVCWPLLPPSFFPSIRVFSNESVLCIRWLSLLTCIPHVYMGDTHGKMSISLEFRLKTTFNCTAQGIESIFYNYKRRITC